MTWLKVAVGFFALMFATGLLFVLPWSLLLLIPVAGYLVLRKRRKPLENRPRT